MIAGLIEKHRANGLLIDTNLMVLRAVRLADAGISALCRQTLVLTDDLRDQFHPPSGARVVRVTNHHLYRPRNRAPTEGELQLAQGFSPAVSRRHTPSFFSVRSV
jgi:hypothetical protein